MEKFEQGTRYGKRGFKGEPLDPNTNLDGFEDLDVGCTKEIDTHGGISNGAPQATLNRKLSSLTEQVRGFITELKDKLHSKIIMMKSNLNKKLFNKASELNLEEMKVLVEKGADIFSLDEYDESLLGVVVKIENAEECIIYLLDNGFDINSQENYLSRTALIIACSYSNPNNVGLLLKEGADPNLVDENGDSALTQAAAIGCLECIKLLISYGVNINEIRQGRTPLMVALYNQNDNLEMVNFLLENGADINAEGGYGTALWTAISYENLDMVKFLINKGAKIEGIKNIQNETTLDFAERVGNKEIIEYLKS